MSWSWYKMIKILPLIKSVGVFCMCIVEWDEWEQFWHFFNLIIATNFRLIDQIILCQHLVHIISHYDKFTLVLFDFLQTKMFCPHSPHLRGEWGQHVASTVPKMVVTFTSTNAVVEHYRLF